MVRIDDSGGRVKCWLDYPSEVEQLEDAARARDWEQEIAVQLMARVGARVSGALTVTPSDVEWNSTGEYWEVEVLGKNTKGGSKATRDAYLPEQVKKNLDRYQSERGISEDEPYITKSKSTVSRWVRELGDRLSDQTGEERWEHLSTHDLRRSWATHHLVERDTSVRVMMDIGGWSDYSAIEPYLGKPTPARISEEMEDAI